MRPQNAVIVCLLLLAGTQTWAATFYDVLKADPQHKLIMKAVDADPAGTMKKMLQDTAPVTAFVPVDKAFIKAAMKLKSITKGSDSAALMKNHCLVTAILKQHMVPGRFDTAALKEMESRPSMLVTKKMVPNTKGKVTVSWPLNIATSGGSISIASAARVADPSNPNKQVAATQAQIISPHDVEVGSGIIHNIDALLLPMTNLTRLMQITGCKST